MGNFEFNLKDFITKGLAKNNNVRNNPLLVEATGAMPYQKTLEAIEEFTRIDTSALTASFPYPQLFVLSEYILIATSTKIYEFDGSSLTLKLLNLPVSGTWSLVDFKTFIYIVNGRSAVIRNADSGAYERVFPDADSIPYGTCVGNFNGQLLLGNPVGSDAVQDGIEGGPTSPGSNTPSTFAYFGNFHTSATDGKKIVVVELGGFTEHSIITMPDQYFVGSAITDHLKDYGYFGTQKDGGGAITAGEITKIDLSTNTIVDLLDLTAGSCAACKTVTGMAIDSTGTYMYVCTFSPVPSVIHKIRLSDFTEFDTLTLNAGEFGSVNIVIDKTDTFAYVATGTASNLIVKIQLSNFSRVGVYTNAALGNAPNTDLYIDSTNTFLYALIWSSGGTPTAIMHRITLASWGTDSTILTHDATLNASMVVDESTNIAYVGRSNGDVLKIDLTAYTVGANLAVGAGGIGWLSIDTQQEFIYVGDQTGDIFKIDIATFTQVGGAITPSIATDYYDSGTKSNGVITN